MNAASSSKADLKPTIENGNPTERQAHCLRSAQEDIRNNLELLKVDVRLIEPIEHHQAVRSGVAQPLCGVGHVAEERPELDSHRNLDSALYVFEYIHIHLFDFNAREIEIRWDIVNV